MSDAGGGQPEAGGLARLIRKGLMFGDLIRVDSPAWVARYNRALQKLTGRTTDLTEFHIDLAGVSPEVGDAFGEMDYLRAGTTRQFILLTTEQKTAPLLYSEMNATRDILRRFIAANESALFTLTAKDAVVGSLDAGVVASGTPDDLLALRRIRVVADTPAALVSEGEKLTAMIERFRSEPDAWWDDVLIAQMIAQAKVSGDVTRNPVRLAETAFEVGDYWTSDFGGAYVVRSAREPAVVFADKAQAVKLSGALTLTLAEPNAVAAWLARNALAEPLANARSPEVAALLRGRIGQILADAVVTRGLAAPDDGAAVQRAVARLGDAVPAEVRGLSQLLAYVEQGGAWPVIDSANPAYFYAIRATQGPWRDVVNMLLAELAPHDVRALFILNKPLFYARYRGWDEPRRAFVAEQLARDYQADKQGLRDALFGRDAAPSAPGPWGAKPVASPWGAPSSPFGGPPPNAAALRDQIAQGFIAGQGGEDDGRPRAGRGIRLGPDRGR